MQGYKTGKFNRQWPLEDIVKVKRHAINHNCFTVTCLVPILLLVLLLTQHVAA